jgi:hypothetical protein
MKPAPPSQHGRPAVDNNEPVGRFFTDSIRAANAVCQGRRGMPKSPDCAAVVARETLIKQHFDVQISES